MKKADKKKVFWSTHALERAMEWKIGSLDTLMNIWMKASEYELSEKHKAYKFKKYGMDSLNDTHYYHAPSNMVFTCHTTNTGMRIIVTVSQRSKLDY